MRALPFALTVSFVWLPAAIEMADAKVVKGVPCNRQASYALCVQCIKQRGGGVRNKDGEWRVTRILVVALSAYYHSVLQRCFLASAEPGRHVFEQNAAPPVALATQIPTQVMNSYASLWCVTQ